MQSQLVQCGLNNNGIQFQSIQEQYPVAESVYCYFIVPDTVQQPEQGDCIAVVPVGWRNVSELVCKKVINVENVWGTTGQRFGHVMFESHMLPTVGQQPYQFVYVKNGGLVSGVSRPFTFVTDCGQYVQLLTGLRSTGLQQWIKKLKQTFGIYGDEFIDQKPRPVQYQNGLKYLQRGLEQVLLNEFEGVRCLQQGLQHIQQYVELNQVLPQLFHQEVRRVQQAVQCLEKLCVQYRQNVTDLPQIVKSPIFRQQFRCIQQCLKQLRTFLPVPVSVLVHEPILLRTKIQELFSELPVEYTLIPQSWEQIVYTVGQVLINQEKFEQIQRQLEQERIVSHLKTLCNVLMCQQQQRNQCENGQQIVIIIQKLNQLLREIMQQVCCLRQREQLHMSTTGQKLVKLLSFIQGRNVELPCLREFVLDLVSGQVLSQVSLREYHRDLSNLLDEIEVYFADCQNNQEQRIVLTRTPVEFDLSQQTTPCVGIEIEFNNNIVLPTIEQLRAKINELKIVKNDIELKTPVFDQCVVDVVQPEQDLALMTKIMTKRERQQDVSCRLNKFNF